MKFFKHLSLCVAVTLLLSALPVSADSEIKVIFNDQPLSFDQPPVIINDRVLVPMRAIFETLGATVEWNEESRTATGTKLGVSASITIDDYTMIRNTLDYSIDVPAQLVNDRTMVPLRVISETFGVNVKWDAETRTVQLTSTDKIGKYAWNDKYDYYGEMKNGMPSGYGELRTKDTLFLSNSGKFEGADFLEGTNFYENGNMACGFFKNFLLNGEGYMLLTNDNSAILYAGEWQDGTIIYGKKTVIQDNNQPQYKGSYWQGYFNKDGKLNGKGTFYNSHYDCSYTGNWIDGERDGIFTITDHANNTSFQTTYKNDMVYDKNAQYQEAMAECNQQLKDLWQKQLELQQWYDEEMEKYYTYVKKSPFETEIAESIYAKYDELAEKAGYKEIVDGDNFDSFSRANAERQMAALKSQANAEIIEANNAYIEGWKKSIQAQYNDSLKSIQNQINTIEMQIQQIEQQFSN